jgi:hypothetical protein
MGWFSQRLKAGIARAATGRVYLIVPLGKTCMTALRCTWTSTPAEISKLI